MSKARRQGEDQILKLVVTALAQNQPSGLAEVLKGIAAATNSYGAMLWQLAPPDSSRRDWLFVLADWFPQSLPSRIHEIPLFKSATGEAVRWQETRNIENVNDEAVHHDRFLREAGISVFCSLPITLDDGEPLTSRGAVNLYRQQPVPYAAADLRLAERLASLVPSLHRSIRGRVSVNLLAAVNDELGAADKKPAEEPLSRYAVRKVVAKICQRVSASFQCLETSVFLEDRLERPGRFDLEATTWPKGRARFKKKTYHAQGEEGATAWPLEHGKHVILFDLDGFADASVQRQYPGLTWKDSLQIKSTMRELLGKRPGERLTPLSFIASPVSWGDQVCGVIRCSCPRNGPFYFTHRDLGLLDLVAAQLGRFWGNWLSRSELQEDLRSLDELVRSMIELNSFVHTELTRTDPAPRRIFTEALRVTGDVIKDAHITDVRLVDAKTQELYFAAFHGAAWTQGNRDTVNARRTRRFPLDGSERSAGYHVFSTGEVHMVDDPASEPNYAKSFDDTMRMIVAPLRVSSQTPAEVLGLLDIRSTADRDFPRYAKPIASLLGRQLGLYQFLAKTIGDLQTAIGARERLFESQAQVFADMDHQFKSPIIQAHARVQALLRSVGDDERLKPQILAIRGLCAKAKRVSMNSGLFAALARGETPKAAKQTLAGSEIAKLLIEAGMDNRLMINPAREVHAFVETAGLEVVHAVSIDRDLLEQAVNNVLDNAFKYSYPHTQIVISGGATEKGRFSISIVNEGIPIRAAEVHSCTKYGWQSEWAKGYSDTGSGIGLWVVDHIMKIHDGSLQIEPTRGRKTEVRLLFPMAART